MKETYGFGDMYRSTLDKLLFCKAWTVAEIQRCVDAISAIMGGVEVFYYDKCLEQLRLSIRRATRIDDALRRA